jgi:ankyrin repeat protein
MIAAIQRGDLQKIGIFARLGIRPDSDAFLVGGFMHCAAASGQTQVMAKLQDLGASVDRLDGYGVTPLHVAVHSHRIESLRWLLAHGADPSLKDRNGRTAADYVSSDVPEQQREEFVSALKHTSNQHLQPTPR